MVEHDNTRALTNETWFKFLMRGEGSEGQQSHPIFSCYVDKGRDKGMR